MQRRNLTTCCVVLVAALVLAGCGITAPPRQTLTLRISGTRGTSIAGEYVLTEGSTATRYPLDLDLPFSVEVKGHDLSCVVQKLGGKGTVRVELLVDGVPVAFAWTRDDYGNISVTTP